MPTLIECLRETLLSLKRTRAHFIRDVAEAIGVQPQAIYKALNGEDEFTGSVKLWQDIIEYVEFSPSDFVAMGEKMLSRPRLVKNHQEKHCKEEKQESKVLSFDRVIEGIDQRLSALEKTINQNKGLKSNGTGS